VEAMKCGTPILAGNLTSLPEVAGDAALYCDPFDTTDIANKMGDLVSSENLRKELSSKGLERSKLFSWDNASAIAWEEIALLGNPS
jgi:glycosyltransferase involved in cell wall biosynthesis